MPSCTRWDGWGKHVRFSMGRSFFLVQTRIFLRDRSFLRRPVKLIKNLKLLPAVAKCESFPSTESARTSRSGDRLAGKKLQLPHVRNTPLFLHFLRGHSIPFFIRMYIIAPTHCVVILQFPFNRGTPQYCADIFCVHFPLFVLPRDDARECLSLFYVFSPHCVFSPHFPMY